MELSYRSSSRIFCLLTVVAVCLGLTHISFAKSPKTAQKTVTKSAPKAATADELKAACNRLEGITMPCTGGGSPGVVCGETCPDAPDICSGVVSGKICGNTVTCYGSKCCGTCEALANQYCGTFTVCGKTCTGTITKDCAKTQCLIPHQSTGITTIKTIQDGCTPYNYCGSPVKAGDGCVCDCEMVGDTCEGRDNGKCTQCLCGMVSGCSPISRSICVDENKDCVWYESVPAIQVDPCTCKCPEGTGSLPLPSCGKCPAP